MTNPADASAFRTFATVGSGRPVMVATFGAVWHSSAFDSRMSTTTA